nr:TolC family protein [uncultured Dyadobacter sp.]
MKFYKPYIIAGLIALASYETCAQGRLTLDEAKKMALANNSRLGQADFHIKAAQAAEAGAKAANKPVIDGSVAALHVGKPLDAFLPSVLASPTVTVGQPIYVGGKIRLGQQAAAKGVEIAQAQKQLTETEVLFEVEKSYWQIVSISEKIGLAGRFGVMLDSLYQDLDDSYQAGMIFKNDMLRVQVQKNENELNLARATDGLLMAKMQLAQLMGDPRNTSFAVSDSVTGDFAMLQNDSLLSAVDRRAEIQLIKRALEAQELNRKLLQADFKPSVSLLAAGFGSFGKNINFESGSNAMASYVGMLNVSIPIWDWGMKASKVKEQSFKIQAQKAQLQETQDLLSLEIRNAYLKVNQSAKKIDLSRASVLQAEENLRLSNDRFEAGTVTGQDVLEAQTLWQQATSSIIDAKVEYRVNEAALLKALGELK